VYRDEWEALKFDENTAMKIETVGYSGENEEAELYEFQINMDNTPLLNEIKLKRLDDVPARMQFLYGNVLVGLSLLLQDKEKVGSSAKSAEDSNPTDQETVETRVERTCRALAPFMLALTALGQSDLGEVEEAGDLEEVG